MHRADTTKPLAPNTGSIRFLGHFVRIVVVVVVAVVVIFSMLLFCFSFVALQELVTIAVAFLPIRAGCIAFFTTCRFP
jgi:hypothetical protein